jgi:N6-adenosine-specific RNA methylase IME4
MIALSLEMSRNGKYDIIYADPPWSYKTYNAKGGHKSASAHYNTMTIADICALPVKDISAENSVLFMWATAPNLPEAFEVIKAWGFKYKTVAFVWVKQYRNNDPVCGLGYWTRSNAEMCLLATRGKIARKRKDVRQIVMTGTAQHSRKPHEVRERIVNLMGGGMNKIELFARERNELFNEYEGWHVWGNEIKSDIELKTL